MEAAAGLAPQGKAAGGAKASAAAEALDGGAEWTRFAQAAGRWLRDARVVDDYARFWFHGDGFRKQYTWWAAHALHQRSLLRRRQQRQRHHSGRCGQ